MHALEKEMATHSSILAWRIPGMEEPGRLQSMGSLESDTTEQLHFHFSLLRIGEGNGNPLQCSCLENPRDGGAWWAAISGVAQSRTRLKRLAAAAASILAWRIPGTEEPGGLLSMGSQSRPRLKQLSSSSSIEGKQ